MPSLTPAAAAQIRAAGSPDDEGLRIAAHFDEAAGEMQYGIGFDERREQDEVFTVDGVTLLVSPLSIEAVAPLTIDYVEIAPNDFRFIFFRADDTPPAAKPGGCGNGGCAGCGPKS